MKIVKEIIYHAISRAMASGAEVCPHCLLQLAVLAPNRRLSDLLLLYAYLIKLQQEEGVLLDPKGVHALQEKIMRLCRKEIEKCRNELVEYCQGVLASDKPEWQIIAEQHGWKPPVSAAND